MRQIALILALLLAVLTVSTPLSAKIYKWVDSSGKTHYTQSPPPQDAQDSRVVKPETQRRASRTGAQRGGAAGESYCRALSRFANAVAQERSRGARSADVAFLAVDDPSTLPPALPVAAADSRLGGEVFTIGYPHPELMGKAPKLTTGNISSLAGIKDDPRMYQISVPLQGGNSGGPLIDGRGVVVGIVTAKIRAVDVYRATGDLPENVNYAVKASTLRPLMAQVASSHGARIRSVPPGEGSVADIAGHIQNSVLMVVSE